MSGCRVFIGHLSPHARERDVEKFFKGYGRIREINLKNGFGFVVSCWPLVIFRLCTPLAVQFLLNLVILRSLMTTEMQMMLFMSWMAKSCAVKGMKLLFAFFWIYFELLTPKDLCKLAAFACHVKAEFQVFLVGLFSYYVCYTMAVTFKLRLSFSFQGHNWTCSLQTGQRWRPRNGTLWWWWWWRLSALSQQWTQVMTSFFYINHTYLSLFKMMFFCFQIWPPCSHWAQTHCGEPFLPNQLAGKVSLILPKYLTPVPF